MNTPDERDLITRALRDQLSAEEKRDWQALLQRDAALRDRFNEEMALERALHQLPNVKISSNFTSLVLQAATRPEQRKSRSSIFPRFIFRSGLAGAVASLALVSALGIFVAQYYRKAARADMAVGVRSFTEVASVIGSSQTPAAEVFQNFEAIQRLPAPADSELDVELLVALQK